MFKKLKEKINSIFSKGSEKKGIDINKLKETMDVNKEIIPVKKVIKKVSKEEKKKELQEKYSRSWMLVGTPDKWFGDKVEENATVNDILLRLDKGSWEITKALSKNIKPGDKGVIKIGNDTRSKERRTLNLIERHKLESGIYAVIEFKSIEEDEGVYRANFKVIKNLYKDKTLLGKEKSEKILGKVNRTKEIDKNIVDKILQAIEE